MPVRSDLFAGSYNPKQLQALQSAYRETCKLLGRDPLTQSEAHQLAKRIYMVYDSGIENPIEIARVIQHAESI